MVQKGSLKQWGVGCAGVVGMLIVIIFMVLISVLLAIPCGAMVLAIFILKGTKYDTHKSGYTVRCNLSEMSIRKL